MAGFGRAAGAVNTVECADGAGTMRSAGGLGGENGGAGKSESVSTEKVTSWSWGGWRGRGLGSEGHVCDLLAR